MASSKRYGWSIRSDGEDKSHLNHSSSHSQLEPEAFPRGGSKRLLGLRQSQMTPCVPNHRSCNMSARQARHLGAHLIIRLCLSPGSALRRGSSLLHTVALGRQALLLGSLLHRLPTRREDMCDPVRTLYSMRCAVESTSKMSFVLEALRQTMELHTGRLLKR